MHGPQAQNKDHPSVAESSQLFMRSWVYTIKRHGCACLVPGPPTAPFHAVQVHEVRHTGVTKVHSDHPFVETTIPGLPP